MNRYLSRLLFLGVFVSSASLAALEAPHELVPPLSVQDDDASMDTDAGVGYEEPPTPAIDVGPVGNPPTGGFGTLTEKATSLPQAIWKSDIRESDEFLLTQFRTGIANDTMRDLLIKLLMVQSPPPSGNSMEDWLVLRVNALAGIGQDAKVMEMINALPSSLVTGKILQLQAEIELAHGDYDKACQRAKPGVRPADDVSAFWQKLGIVCAARSGKSDETMVGIDMLRETNADDPFFQDIIRHIGNKNMPVKSLPKNISIFDFALIKIAGETNRLGDRIDSLPAIALKYLSEDTSVDVKLRDKAISKAMQTGIIPTSETNKMPEQPFSKPLASDVITLVTALGSGNPANSADNAVIARLDLDEAGIQDSRRISRLLSCMEIFGYKVQDKIWQKLLSRKSRFDGEIPSAMLIDRLNQAALANRKGEVILTAALIGGGFDAEKMSDLALIPIIKALKSIGFEKEARNFAYSAVKNYK